MKIPKSYEGKWVGLHLARPVYMFEYGAHVKWRDLDGLMPQLMMKPSGPPPGPGEEPKLAPAATDMIMGARVVTVTDDTIELLLYVPDADNQGGVLMRSMLPSALVIHVATVEEYDVSPPPEVVSKQRQPQPKSRVIF